VKVPSDHSAKNVTAKFCRTHRLAGFRRKSVHPVVVTHAVNDQPHNTIYLQTTGLAVEDWIVSDGGSF
jgi:hypothetical protein